MFLQTNGERTFSFMCNSYINIIQLILRIVNTIRKDYNAVHKL